MRGTASAAFLLRMQHRDVLAAFFIGIRVIVAATSQFRSFLYLVKLLQNEITVIHSHSEKANLPF
jgi:hypothetical protein